MRHRIQKNARTVRGLLIYAIKEIYCNSSSKRHIFNVSCALNMTPPFHGCLVEIIVENKSDLSGMEPRRLDVPSICIKRDRAAATVTCNNVLIMQIRPLRCGI